MMLLQHEWQQLPMAVVSSWCNDTYRVS